MLQQRIGLRDEARDLRYRHRDVVLDVAPLLRLRLGDQSRAAPTATALRDRLRDHRVAGKTGFDRVAGQRFEQAAGVRLRFVVADFEQDVRELRRANGEAWPG